jgi:hypothetical protein
MNEIEQIQAQLQPVDDFASSFDAAVRAREAARQGKDRSFIVYAVICLYVGAVITLTIVYLLYLGMWEGERMFSDLSELTKIAILPIMTLVIGYYFGTKSA